jgi:hypothetical protein
VSPRGRAVTTGAAVRSEKIRTAQARISAGFYDRPDVRERVLAALLDDLDDA